MKNNDKLLLPRAYLSYSQMTCWLTNKDRFRREYFEGGPKLDTKYLQFGKGVASMIEDGSYKEILPDLEIKGTPEYKIIVDIAGVPCLSYVDEYIAPEHYFREFKTGKIPWTQAKVQKHEQLPFYAAALKAWTGTMPTHCELLWFETTEKSIYDPNGSEQSFWDLVEKKISLTGKTVVFRRDFDEREIERVERLIRKTAEEIDCTYRAFLAEI